MTAFPASIFKNETTLERVVVEFYLKRTDLIPYLSVDERNAATSGVVTQTSQSVQERRDFILCNAAEKEVLIMLLTGPTHHTLLLLKTLYQLLQTDQITAIAGSFFSATSNTFDVKQSKIINNNNY